MAKEFGFRIGASLVIALIFMQCGQNLLGDWKLYSTVAEGVDTDYTNTLVTINPQTGEMSQVGPKGGTPWQENLAADPISGFLYGTNENAEGVITKIDPSTGQWTQVATIWQDETLVNITSLSFSPSGKLYGISDYTTLGVINLGTSTFTPIAELNIPFCAYGMAFSPQGLLYIVDSSGIGDTYQQWLRTVDVLTGDITSTIPTGQYDAGDLDFAPDGYIYHTNFSWELFKINPATGEQIDIGSGSLGPFGGIASMSLKKVCPYALAGDLNGDCKVDIADLEVLCKQWLFEDIPSDLFPPGGDGIVDFADFAIFADQWGIMSGYKELLDFTRQWLKRGLPLCSADINGDGIVNFLDFSIMADNWLVDCSSNPSNPACVPK